VQSSGSKNAQKNRESTQELKRQLDETQGRLRANAKGFEALAVVVQYLNSQVGFQCSVFRFRLNYLSGFFLGGLSFRTAASVDQPEIGCC